MEIVPVSRTTIGQAANLAAKQTLLQDYHARMSAQTLRRQRADIALLERFLASAGYACSGLYNDLAGWAVMTWGLVEAFNRWQLLEGYAVGSLNVRLATIKVYCGLAAKAGHLNSAESALIKSEVRGYRQKEARNMDEKRPQTRREHAKKAAPVPVGSAHVALLKEQPDTKRGRADALLVALIFDHGLRCGEIAGLDVANIDLANGKLSFYRHKVDLWQEHDLTPDTYRAAQAYLADCTPGQGPLFIGVCSKARVNERTLNHRIGVLCKSIGLAGGSPHDGRHFWATDAIKNGTDVKALQDAGGWSSPAMPLRYAASAKTANKGVKLTATRKDT